MIELIEIEQIQDLAEYMGMRLMPQQAQMWLKDFRDEKLTKKDFQCFSNYWRKNKDTAFKPKNVFEFLGTAGLKKDIGISENKYCEKCGHSGWIEFTWPKNERGTIFRCTCNNKPSVQDLMTVEDFLNSDFYKENHGVIERVVYYK